MARRSRRRHSKQRSYKRRHSRARSHKRRGARRRTAKGFLSRIRRSFRNRTLFPSRPTTYSTPPDVRALRERDRIAHEQWLANQGIKRVSDKYYDKLSPGKKAQLRRKLMAKRTR